MILLFKFNPCGGGNSRTGGDVIPESRFAHDYLSSSMVKDAYYHPSALRFMLYLFEPGNVNGSVHVIY